MRVKEYTEVTEALKLVGVAQQVLQDEGGANAAIALLDMVESKLGRALYTHAPEVQQMTLVQEGDGSCHG